MIIKIQVKPNAKNDSLEILEEGAQTYFLVNTKSPAHDNLANQSVVKILADHFKTAKANIKIKSGSNSKIKFVQISV